MELTSAHSDYRTSINKLLSDMQLSYDSGLINQHTSNFQNRLDRIANAYQNDDSLSNSRYKLYEAQAYLHYFRGNDESALNFINEAVNMKGDDYSDAANFRSLISGQQTNYTESYPHQPIEGWLAFFIFSLSIGAIYNLYEFFSELTSFKNLTPDIQTAYPSLRPLMVFEITMFLVFAIVAVVVVVLIFQRKIFARWLGITLVCGSSVWMVVDYSIAENMFTGNSSALNSINSTFSSGAHFILIDIVWLLYLIFSKQVKQTLIAD